MLEMQKKSLIPVGRTKRKVSVKAITSLFQMYKIIVAIIDSSIQTPHERKPLI